MGSSYLNDVVALLLKNGFEQIKDGDAIVSSYFPSKDMTDKIRKAIDEAYASGFVGPFETAEEAMKFLLK